MLILVVDKSCKWHILYSSLADTTVCLLELQMMKEKRFFLVLTIILIFLCAFVGCNDTGAQIKFMVDDDVYESFDISSIDTLPDAPKKTGFVFVGWFYDEGIWQQPFSLEHFDKSSAEDVTVYAYLAEPNTSYTATFEAFDGSAVDPIEDKVIATSPESTKPGHALEGWYSNSNFTADSKIHFPYVMFQDVTLYAKWQVQTVEGFTLAYIGANLGYSVTKYSGNSANVVVPDEYDGQKISKIGDGAFKNNSSLYTITLSSNITAIENSAFFGCANLQAIDIPEGVTSISSLAFSGCRNLTTISIPSTLTSIGGNAFTNCSSLTAINISDIAKWCQITFTNNAANPLFFANSLYLNGELVTNLTLPEGLTKIGDFAFSQCTTIVNATLPSTLTTIGSYSFWGCTNLLYITIPASVDSIGSQAFRSCEKLGIVTFEDTSTWYHTNSSSGYYQKTGGTEISVAYPTSNAQNLTTLQYSYWYKK